MERVRSRGQVNRSRVSLKFDTPEQPAAGTPLLSEGKEFGYVTRAAFSPAANAFIGMGYVRREKSAPGSALEVSAGGVATVYAPLVERSPQPNTVDAPITRTVANDLLERAGIRKP